MATPVRKPNLSANDFLAMIQSVGHNCAEEPEEGFFTAQEWAVHLQKSDSRTRRYLYDLQKAGKVEMKKFRVKCLSTIRPVPHYRFVHKDKKR